MQRKKLRPYQIEAVEAAKKQLYEGPHGLGKKFMMVLPTGSGKTIIIAEITKYAVSLGLKVLIVKPRKRLFLQTVKELPYHGKLSGKFGRDLGADHSVLITTYQTATQYSVLDIIPDVVIIDECHMVPEDGCYAELLNRYPNASVFGLTATPFRANTHIEESVFKWKTIFQISITQLIADGFLVPPVSMFTDGHAVKDDIDTKDLSEVTDRIVKKMILEVQKKARNRCVFFCKDIAHAKLASDTLMQLGEKNVFLVHSEMTDDHIERAYAAFETASDKSWLINVGLLSVGVDIPCIDCIAILRDVKTFALLVQIIGRGLRLFGGKTSCLIYDFGYGLERFGFIDAPELGRVRQEAQAFSAEKKEYAFKPCAKCNVMNPFNRSVCKCGECFSLISTISIKDYAVSQPLFINEIVEKECLYVPFDRVARTQGRTGIYIDTFTFNFHGRELKATKAYAFQPPSSIPFASGKLVLVRRIAGDLVEIV